MKALIFGAGKIARGFVAQLLFRSGFSITFAECNPAYARRLDEAGRYYVNVMGNPAQSQWIQGYRCLSFEDMDAVADALANADIVFTSVIGKNLPSLGHTIAQAFIRKAHWAGEESKTIVTCENWKNPATVLRQAILDALLTPELRTAFQNTYGVTEAVVMRSAVEPTSQVLEIDPLAVSVHDYWRLPVDAAHFRGSRLPIEGVEYLEDFQGFLQQKVYTYNAGNATIAYLGALKGHKLLSDAANDPEIIEILNQVYGEINPAICHALNIAPEKQIAFAQSAIRKYQDRNIIDFTERHARDPLRKLGPEDRIVGAARLVERQGGEPLGLATTLAAAIYYRSENKADPTGDLLVHMRREGGVDHVLKDICQICPEENLARQVHDRIQVLKERGWINET